MRTQNDAHCFHSNCTLDAHIRFYIVEVWIVLLMLVKLVYGVSLSSGKDKFVWSNRSGPCSLSGGKWFQMTPKTSARLLLFRLC